MGSTRNPTPSVLDSLLALPTEEAAEFSAWRPNGAGRNHRTVPTAGLTAVEVRFLRAVIDNPAGSSSALPRKLQISARRSIEIRRALIEGGYLREHRVNLGARGRAAIVLEALAPAFEALILKSAPGGSI